jgi:hypothetical protein
MLRCDFAGESEPILSCDRHLSRANIERLTGFTLILHRQTPIHNADARIGYDDGPERERPAMTTFDNRKDTAEKKFAHDAELQFKASARRNKLLGQWTAGQLGLSGAEAEAYAKSVVMSDFEEAGDEDVFRKVRKDLDGAKIEVSDHVVRRTMDELMAKAIEEIKAGS